MLLECTQINLFVEIVNEFSHSPERSFWNFCILLHLWGNQSLSSHIYQRHPTLFLQHLRILRVHCNLDLLRASDLGKCTGLWLAADTFISLYCNWYNREGKMVNKTACLTKVSPPYIISVIVQYMKNIKSMYIEAKLMLFP